MKAKKIRPLIACIVATVMLFTSLSLVSCSTPPPEIDDIRERIIYLLEESQEINSIFWGEGLPVYERDDPKYQEFYTDTEMTTYEYVTLDSKYQSIDAIKESAAKVYSAELLERIYQAAFDGVSLDTNDALIVSTARFYEDKGGLMQSIYVRNPVGADVSISSERVFDYDSIEILVPSNGSFINVSIDSWLKSDANPDGSVPASKITNIKLQFALSETDNLWYLDSPSY